MTIPAASTKWSGRWKQYRRAILRSFALISVSLAAIIAVQLPVDPPPLPLKALGGSQWVTTAAYTSTVAGVVTVIPANFTNDLASIPSLAADALGIDRNHPAIRRGALVHDWHYFTKDVPREDADYLLWQACLEDGMHPDKAWAVYQWVQEWGFVAWGRQQTR